MIVVARIVVVCAWGGSWYVYSHYLEWMLGW